MNRIVAANGSFNIVRNCVLLLACIAASGQDFGYAAEPIKIGEVNHPGQVDFEKEILPILRKNCLACHNATDAESELVLESPAAIKKGGSAGPAVVAGKGLESYLLQVASFQEEPIMPPEDNDVGAKPLTSAELGLLKLWIDQGATGEVTGGVGPVSWQPLPVGVNPIYSVAISSDGQYAAAGRANQIFTYHVGAKRELGRLTDPSLLQSGTYSKPGVAHLDLVQSLALNASGDLLASGGYQNIKLWRRPVNQTLAEVPGLDNPVKSMATSRDGNLIAVGQTNGQVKIFSATEKKLQRTLIGHTGEVRGVCFSGDGKSLVSGGQDKTLRKWNLESGQEVQPAITTVAEINAVVFCADDKLIASAHQDNMIRTWNAETAAGDTAPSEGEQNADGDQATGPKPVIEIAGHSGAVTALAVVPSNTAQIVSGAADSTARIWDVNAGRQIRQINAGAAVASVAVKPDGQAIATAGAAKSVKLWNASNGQQLVELKGDITRSIDVETKELAATMGQRLIDIAKKDLEEANKRKKSEEDNLKKSQETKTKAEEEFKKKEEAAKKPTADKEAADKVVAEKKPARDAAEQQKKQNEDALKKATEILAERQKQRDEANKGDNEDAKKKALNAFNEANAAKTAAAAAKTKADQEFTKLENELKQAEAKLKQVTTPYQKAVDERTAADRALKASIRSIERANASVKKATDAVPVAESAVKSAEGEKAKRQGELDAAKQAAADAEKNYGLVAFSMDGSSVVTVNESGVICTWDTASGAAIEKFEGDGARIGGIAFQRSGDIVSASDNKKIVVWDSAPDWKLERTIGSVQSSDALEGRVTALRFSDDGQWLASGSGDPSRSGQLKIWNVADGNLIREIKDAHSDTIYSVQFSPDRKHIASSAADRFMKVHNSENGQFYKSFEGHTHHVLGVSWSADGLTLATSGADKVIKVWDFRTGEQKRTITGFKKEVTAIRFAGQSINVLASCGDKQVHSKRVDNGGNVRTYGGATDYVYSVDVSANGKIVVSGGADSVVRMWNVADGKSIANFEPPKLEETVAANP